MHIINMIKYTQIEISIQKNINFLYIKKNMFDGFLT